MMKEIVFFIYSIDKKKGHAIIVCISNYKSGKSNNP